QREILNALLVDYGFQSRAGGVDIDDFARDGDRFSGSADLQADVHARHLVYLQPYVSGLVFLESRRFHLEGVDADWNGAHGVGAVRIRAGFETGFGSGVDGADHRGGYDGVRGVAHDTGDGTAHVLRRE